MLTLGCFFDDVSEKYPETGRDPVRMFPCYIQQEGGLADSSKTIRTTTGHSHSCGNYHDCPSVVARLLAELMKQRWPSGKLYPRQGKSRLIMSCA